MYPVSTGCLPLSCRGLRLLEREEEERGDAAAALTVKLLL